VSEAVGFRPGSFVVRFSGRGTASPQIPEFFWRRVCPGESPSRSGLLDGSVVCSGRAACNSRSYWASIPRASRGPSDPTRCRMRRTLHSGLRRRRRPGGAVPPAPPSVRSRSREHDGGAGLEQGLFQTLCAPYVALHGRPRAAPPALGGRLGGLPPEFAFKRAVLRTAPHQQGVARSRKGGRWM